MLWIRKSITQYRNSESITIQLILTFLLTWCKSHHPLINLRTFFKEPAVPCIRIKSGPSTSLCLLAKQRTIFMTQRIFNLKGFFLLMHLYILWLHDYHNDIHTIEIPDTENLPCMRLECCIECLRNSFRWSNNTDNLYPLWHYSQNTCYKCQILDWLSSRNNPDLPYMLQCIDWHVALEGLQYTNYWYTVPECCIEMSMLFQSRPSKLLEIEQHLPLFQSLNDNKNNNRSW